jgi:hypothetical protein
MYYGGKKMKRTKIIAGILVGIGLLIASACGPSAEEQATMTAASWTATPLPTNTPSPTPTPVPYDVDVSVVDGDGNPVVGAELTYAEMEDTQVVGETGSLSWMNVNGDTATFSVTAQGYLPAEQEETLQRGPNSIDIALERDPYGVLPSEACAPNENLVYLEDFQDGHAPEWQQIDFQAAGWSINEFADQPGNLVASNSVGAEAFLGNPNVNDPNFQEFDQAVWRLWYFSSGPSAVAFNWHHSGNYDIDAGHVDDARYMIIVDTTAGDAIRRVEIPLINFMATGSGYLARAGQWHFVEISTFDGRTQLWIDGKMVASYNDPRPLNPGTISLNILSGPTSPDTVVSFASMSVCDLSEPFTSIYVAPESDN